MSDDRSGQQVSPRLWRLMLISAIVGELGIAMIALDNFLSGDVLAGSLRLLLFVCLGGVFVSVLYRIRRGDS